MSLDAPLSQDAVIAIARERQRQRFGHVIDPILDETGTARTAATTIVLGPDSPLNAKAKRLRGSKRSNVEYQEQSKLFAWAQMAMHQWPELWALFAVPNWLGLNTRARGGKAKTEGRKKGVPDVWLPVARGGFHGLVIEMKAGTNTPSVDQRRWLLFLDAAGWVTRVCYSATEAQLVISAYLGGQITETTGSAV